MYYRSDTVNNSSIENATFDELNLMARRAAQGLNDGTLDMLKGMGIEQAAAWMRSADLPTMIENGIYGNWPELKAEVEKQKAAEITQRYEDEQKNKQQPGESEGSSIWPWAVGALIVLLIIK